MARYGFDFSEFEKYEQKIKKLSENDKEKMFIKTIKEIAKRYLNEVIKVTPVGNYTDGRVGGTLRRNWTVDPVVKKIGGNYVIEVVNNTEYGSYVNYGHRNRGGKGWVEGQFFMEIAAEKVEGKMDRDIERVVVNFLKEAFGEN